MQIISKSVFIVFDLNIINIKCKYLVLSDFLKDPINTYIFKVNYINKS